MTADAMKAALDKIERALKSYANCNPEPGFAKDCLILLPTLRAALAPVTRKVECAPCGGSGEVYTSEVGTGTTCSYCLGDGSVDEPASLAPQADGEVDAIRERHTEMQEVYGDEAICPMGQRDRATLLDRDARHLAEISRLSAELAKERERRVEVEGALRPFVVAHDLHIRDDDADTMKPAIVQTGYFRIAAATLTKDKAMTKPEETDDGYIVIQPIKPVENAIKGIKCGACGTKFDHGKAYGYSCHRIDCPVFPKITC